MTTNPTTNFPIDRVLAAFEKGDVPTLLGSVADDMDFRIDHYRDDADTSWQVARNKADLLAVVSGIYAAQDPVATQRAYLARFDTPQ